MELIRRETKAKKENFLEENSKIQIAYNSFGHITIRLFNEPKWHYDEKSEVVKETKNIEKDILVVFTAAQSREIINFVQKLSLRYGRDC